MIKYLLLVISIYTEVLFWDCRILNFSILTFLLHLKSSEIPSYQWWRICLAGGQELLKCEPIRTENWSWGMQCMVFFVCFFVCVFCFCFLVCSSSYHYIWYLPLIYNVMCHMFMSILRTLCTKDTVSFKNLKNTHMYFTVYKSGMGRMFSWQSVFVFWKLHQQCIKDI